MLNKFQVDTIKQLQLKIKGQLLLKITPLSDDRKNVFIISFPVDNAEYQSRILHINSTGQISIHLFPNCNPEEYKNFIFNHQTLSHDSNEVMQQLQLTNNPNSLKSECLKFIKANLDNPKIGNVKTLTRELEEELKAFNL